MKTIIAILSEPWRRYTSAHLRHWGAMIRNIEGQDVIEYALIAGFVGIAGWAALSTIDNSVATTYNNWVNGSSGVNSLWIPAEPISSGS